MKKLFFIILYYAGLGHLLMYFNKRKNKIPVLVFHRVTPETDNYWIPLTPAQFESSIRFLAKEYRFISLDEMFSGDKKRLKHACAIVFDDTFKDFHTHVLPIIKKYNLPVTMFAPVDCINKNEIIWTSQLDNCFKFSTKKELNITIQGQLQTFRFENENEKIRAAFRVQQLLKTLPNQEREFCLAEIKKTLGYKDDPNISIMSWDDLKQSQNIVDYQSHSMTHPVLASIQDEQQLVYEIDDSKTFLEKELKSPVNYFAYPMGEYSDAVLKIIKKNYKAAFAVKDRLVQLNELNNDNYRYEIPRVNVYHTNRFELFFRMNGFHRFFGK